MIATTNHHELEHQWREAWRPKPRRLLSDVCTSTVRLSHHWEAGRGKYDLKDNPFWRDILNAMQDPEVRQISVMKSTRVGGTLLLIAALLGLSEIDPGPAMIVTPDNPSMTELRDRIYDTAAESPLYAPRIPPEHRRNNRFMDFRTCRCYLGQAGSAQSLRGRTCRRVFRSEIDVYPPRSARGGGNPLKASAERVKRSFYSLIYSESSPDSETSAIAAEHAQGNQMVWQCPCPHCGTYQELRFFPYKSGPNAGRGGVVGYLDEAGQIRSADEARANAHYVCIKGCRIENSHKHDMVCAGVWVPKGCHVVDGVVEGTPKRSRRHISVHLWSIHVPRINFSELAAAYVDHWMNGELKEWFQNWLGLQYRSGRKPPRWDTLGRRYEGYHARGEVPHGVWFLTAGVDVQLMGCYWSVYGWGHLGRRWLIDWGYIPRYLGSSDELQDDDVADLEYCNIASDLKQLQLAVMDRKFRTFADHKTPHGYRHMSVLSVGIDSNYRTNAVHRYVHQLGNPRVRAVRGDHQVEPKDRWRKSIVDKDRKGVELKQSRTVWGVSVSHYKMGIYERFHAEPGSAHSITFPRGMVKIGREWLMQACNERLAEVPDPKTNKTKMMWVEESNRIGSHHLDGCVYAEFCADLQLEQLELTWDSNSWLQKNNVEQPKQMIVRQYQQA